MRADGSNATIIGPAPGEFAGDRNAIARVWMDHGAWPLTALLLYIDQTGDYDILLADNTYFRDAQMARLDDMRLELVAVASHELRTPLTTMRMTLSMLQERAASYVARDRELVATAMMGVEQLLVATSSRSRAT